MVEKKTMQNVLCNPSTILTERSSVERSFLEWYLRIIQERYFQEGYFIKPDSYKLLNLPPLELFEQTEGESDLGRIYRKFSWLWFTKHCVPDIQNNQLVGFNYSDGNKLSAKQLAGILRYPNVDWINQILTQPMLQISDELRDLMQRSRLDTFKVIQRNVKNEISRILCTLHLMESMLFISITYNDALEREVVACTRCPELLTMMVPTHADELIHKLNKVENFNVLSTHKLQCVKLTTTVLSATKLDYTAELVEIDLDRSNSYLVPFVCYQAYCDGFSQHINDMPTKAATLTIEMQKAGDSERQCTLSPDVFKMVYSCQDSVKTNMRMKFNCGLDIEDYAFKYFNLQGSLNAKRPFSGFNPISLRGVRLLTFNTLDQSVLQLNSDNVKKVFSTAVKMADDKQIKMLSVACGIDIKRPALRELLLEYNENHHATEVYRIIAMNMHLFKFLGK